MNLLALELVEKEKELVVAEKRTDDVLKEVVSKASAAEKVKDQVQVIQQTLELVLECQTDLLQSLNS